MRYKLMLLGCYLLAGAVAQAQDEDYMPEIHGAVMQSFIYTTDDNEYLVKNSDEGSFEWTEFLLNATKEFGPLRVGGQIVSRSFGEQGNFDTKLDWAYGDYRYDDMLGLRAGKIKLPMGFYNEYRDVDIARVSIIQDNNIYNEEMRNIVNTYEGGGAYGMVGPLSYQAFYGTSTMDIDEIEAFRAAGDMFNASLSLHTDYIFGGSLIWETPLDGLRGGLTATKYRGNVEGEGSVNDIPVEVALTMDAEYYVGSLEYCYDSYVLTAEGFYQKWEQETAEGIPDVMSTKIKVWYAKASKQMTDALAAEIGYHMAWNDKDTDLKQNYIDTVSLALRYDLTPNAVLKLEYDYNHGTMGVADAPNAEKDWSMIIARTTFVF